MRSVEYELDHLRRRAPAFEVSGEMRISTCVKALGLFGIALLSDFRVPGRGVPEANQPSVILLVLDQLRADRLQGCDHGHPTTFYTDQLAGRRPQTVRADFNQGAGRWNLLGTVTEPRYVSVSNAADGIILVDAVRCERLD
jgi:hypothetical protein